MQDPKILQYCFFGSGGHWGTKKTEPEATLEKASLQSVQACILLQYPTHLRVHSLRLKWYFNVLTFKSAECITFVL